jgi:hypothetical protein
MGNQVGSIEENKKDQQDQIGMGIGTGVKKIKVDSQANTEFAIIKDSYSSYKGIKTDTSEGGVMEGTKDTTATVKSKENPSEKEPLFPTNTDKEIEISEVKIPTKFEWKEGGNIVYVTGSFSNWQQWFIMNKNIEHNNIFDIILVH